MVNILATSAPGAQTNAPTITLPANIAANSYGYILVEASSANAPIDMPGWTQADSPRQAGNGVTLGVLFQKTVGPADSGTTVTGTITTTGTPRWGAVCIVSDGPLDGITYGMDSSPDTSLDVPAFTPNSDNAMAVILGGATVLSGLGHATWTPPAGYTEIVDSGSSYGTLNEINTFAARRQLAVPSGTVQPLASSTLTQSARANVWVLTFKNAPVAANATHVGGSVGSSPASSVTGPTLTMPAGKAAGDIGILYGAWNPSTNATPTVPSGWTLLGAVHNVASTLSVATWTKTLTAGDGNVIPTFAVAARGGFTLDVWRNVVAPTSVVYADPTVTAQTASVPAVTGLTGPAVFTTSWCERSGVDTTVTVPAGTTLVDATFPTGSGSVQVAAAFNATSDSDGSVGSGVWARGTISPAASANVSVATVGMLVASGSAPVSTASSRSRYNGTTWVAQNTSRL